MAYMGIGNCEECGFNAEHDEVERMNNEERIETLNAIIAGLKVEIAGMKLSAETDWGKECDKLYNFLSEHKPYKNYPKGKLLDEYCKETIAK